MGSTEPDGDAGADIVPLTTADLSGALTLSASAQWNQNEADWRGMLERGRGWGVLGEAAPSPQPSPASGRGGEAEALAGSVIVRGGSGSGAPVLAASVVVLPYGASFAWVSMVLVLPAFRRRGYASLLLRHALAALAKEGRGAVLDATPAGHAVYVQEGFRDTWGFARYRREAGAAALPRTGKVTTRAITAADWPAIDALDTPTFGASRLELLRTLAARLPQAARVAESSGRLLGYVVGRDGREASQIGPLVAEDEATAQALLADALAAVDGPVYVDLLDVRTGLRAWLEGQGGFALQRPFTRMVHGLQTAPGDVSRLYAVAGPELG